MRLYVSIWFPYLKTDWLIKKNPNFRDKAFVLVEKQRGRMVITAVDPVAVKAGIYVEMTLADARAISPGLETINDEAGMEEKLLLAMAQWCIRFTPVAAVDGTDGLILEATGCCHLWGGEEAYPQEIKKRFTALGYTVKVAMAPTIGAAWALARYAPGTVLKSASVILQALEPLPPAALRIDQQVVQKLHISGLYRIAQFIQMPSTALRRRFGATLLVRMAQALGNEPEWISPVEAGEEYMERLPCMEPVFTATAIEIAIKQMLEQLCTRFQREQKGLRHAVLKCYRADHKIIEITIGTGSASCNAIHLFKLFEVKIDTIEPGFGIELFTLTASKVQELKTAQHALWLQPKGINDVALSELIDRVRMKVPGIHISRFLPQQHYWPERSFMASTDIHATTETAWAYTRPRPLRLLNPPHAILVTAPIPDYPPMSFRYKGTLHKIIKADGPERIEPEWWISEGQHRDYYYVEDQDGKRYWLFRAGHYDADKNYQWFLHGFFA